MRRFVKVTTFRSVAGPIADAQASPVDHPNTDENVEDHRPTIPQNRPDRERGGVVPKGPGADNRAYDDRDTARDRNNRERGYVQRVSGCAATATNQDGGE